MHLLIYLQIVWYREGFDNIVSRSCEYLIQDIYYKIYYQWSYNNQKSKGDKCVVPCSNIFINKTVVYFIASFMVFSGHTRICEKYTNPGIYRSPHFLQKALLSPIKLPLRHHHHEPMLPINRIVLPSLTSKEYRRKLKDHTFDSVYGSNRHSNRICAIGQRNYPNPYDTVQC